jgi:hypothetical protein
MKILRSESTQSGLVGEEEVEQSRDINQLREGAGETVSLKGNGYFECCPYPESRCKTNFRILV